MSENATDLEPASAPEIVLPEIISFKMYVWDKINEKISEITNENPEPESEPAPNFDLYFNYPTLNKKIRIT